MQLQYQNAGYEATTVEAQTAFSDSDTRVAIAYMVSEGPQVFVDHVLIVGNVRTTHATIQRELRLRAERSLQPRRRSTRASAGSRRSASSAACRITELPHGEETKRDLLVTVEESPPTTVGYGGGGEFLRRLVASGKPTRRRRSRPCLRRAPSCSSGGATCSARTGR